LPHSNKKQNREPLNRFNTILLNNLLYKNCEKNIEDDGNMKTVNIDDNQHAQIIRIVENSTMNLDYPSITHFITQAIKTKLAEELPKLEELEKKGVN
jgi:hypothetical protein